MMYFSNCSTWQIRLLQTSTACALLALCLLSLDMFPWLELPYMPPRPTYPVALLGVLCFVGSGCWVRYLKDYKYFFILIGLNIALPLCSTLVGIADLDFTRQRETMLAFVRWQVIPLLFLCWFALLFAHLGRERAKRLFNLGMLVVALSNTAHIVLELFANNGFAKVKAFLVSVNSYFRMECIGHGWWPPPYFEGRIRGLFSEPAYMALATMPILGILFYLAYKKRIWLTGIIFYAFVMVQGKIRSGILAFAVTSAFCAVLCVCSFARRRLKKPGQYMLLLAVVLVLALGGHAGFQKIQQRHARGLAEASAVCEYVSKTHAGQNVEPPVFQWGLNSSMMTRYLVMRLDINTAMDHPLGVGFYQRGRYWEPLFDIDLNRSGELRLFVNQAKNDRLLRIPPLNQYSVTLAEYGIPGLIAFLLLCGYICFQAFLAGYRTKDAYIWTMLAAFAGVLAAMNATAAINSLAFYFFAGYVLALSRHQDQTQCSSPGMS